MAWRGFQTETRRCLKRRRDLDNESLGHDPVLLPQVIQAMEPKDNEIYLDLTFGGGGMTRKLLESANCRVVAVDRDPEAVPRAQALKAEFGDRFLFFTAKYSTFEEGLESLGTGFRPPCFDGAILDIGTSSFQLDNPRRGFSLYEHGPLDMRMDVVPQPYSSDSPLIEGAAAVVNFSSESELADIIYYNSDERHSRKIAKRIVEARQIEPITSSKQLADLVVSAIPAFLRNRGHDGVFRHAATRTFQALRMHVNDEISELKRALAASERVLLPGARLVVISFHSTEDRIAKDFFHSTSGKVRPRQGPTDDAEEDLEEQEGRSGSGEPVVEVFNPTFLIPKGYKKVVKPTWAETVEHPRWRSAKMRLGIRTDAPDSVYRPQFDSPIDRMPGVVTDPGRL